MYIREAHPGDNQELQALQARCPQGTNLVVSTVNTPDFFARAKAYKTSRTLVVCEDELSRGHTAAPALHARRLQSRPDGGRLVPGFPFGGDQTKRSLVEVWSTESLVRRKRRTVVLWGCLYMLVPEPRPDARNQTDLGLLRTRA